MHVAGLETPALIIVLICFGCCGLYTIEGFAEYASAITGLETAAKAGINKLHVATSSKLVLGHLPAPLAPGYSGRRVANPTAKYRGFRDRLLDATAKFEAVHFFHTDTLTSDENWVEEGGAATVDEKKDKLLGWIEANL